MLNNNHKNELVFYQASQNLQGVKKMLCLEWGRIFYYITIIIS